MVKFVYLLIVARPPNLTRPPRRKGTESVVTPGTISRITMTSSGFLGTSLSDMIAAVQNRVFN